MPDFDMPEPKRLLVAGDWHGNRLWAYRAIEHAVDADCDTILHLGDFGFWPGGGEPNRWPPTQVNYYTSLVGKLRHYEKMGAPIRLFWIDGNHENHELLNPGSGNEVIRHLPRGHRWSWWGKTWMAIGGGVSVDKKWRRPNIDWFPEETLTPAQFEHILRPGDVDIIVAHDAPEGVDIPGIHAKEKNDNVSNFFPAEQIAESWEHRGLMADIAKDKMPAYWFHGHYHRRYNGVWVDPKWVKGGPGMQVIGLDCDGTHLNLNTVILTEKDLV